MAGSVDEDLAFVVLDDADGDGVEDAGDEVAGTLASDLAILHPLTTLLEDQLFPTQRLNWIDFCRSSCGQHRCSERNRN